VPYKPVPLEFERLSPGEQLARSTEFLERMRTRRSVRQFSREPVEVELIASAVAAAGTAPSGANQQPWTFVVVSDPEVKREIRLAAEAEEREAYEHRMTEEWLRALEPLGTDWRKPHIEEAPYVIVVFEQAYGLDGGRRWKHYYAKESVGIAVGLLLASLHLAGLATLTHTPSPMGFLARILGRPQNERAFCLIPVGYPAAGSTVPKLERKPLAEIMVSVEGAIV
jgi:iodotyrosine deiodinase